MNVALESPPPSASTLETERQRITAEIRRISGRDTLITFILIILVSTASGMVVYWTTGNVAYAGSAAAVFPILGTVMTLLGITKVAGFRSAARQLTDLKNELISLNPVSPDSMKDVETLASRYPLIGDYQRQVVSSGRMPVNAELALYWDFDASTQAKTARGRDFLDRAREAVDD